MSPETYYKIMLFTMGRFILVIGFSVGDFFANGGKQILINSIAQYGGYIGATTVNNVMTPLILIPIVSNLNIAKDFILVSSNMPEQAERVATVTLLFSAAGLITKTGNIPINAAI